MSPWKIQFNVFSLLAMSAFSPHGHDQPPPRELPLAQPILTSAGAIQGISGIALVYDSFTRFTKAFSTFTGVFMSSCHELAVTAFLWSTIPED